MRKNPPRKIVRPVKVSSYQAPKNYRKRLLAQPLWLPLTYGTIYSWGLAGFVPVAYHKSRCGKLKARVPRKPQLLYSFC
jgi:hypothetical protein